MTMAHEVCDFPCCSVSRTRVFAVSLWTEYSFCITLWYHEEVHSSYFNICIFFLSMTYVELLLFELALGCHLPVLPVVAPFS